MIKSKDKKNIVYNLPKILTKNSQNKKRSFQIVQRFIGKSETE